MGIFGFRLTRYDSEYYRIYDKAQGIPLGRIPSFRLLKELLDLRPGELLLDAGCGAGHQLRYFLDGSDASGLGVDASPAALDLVRQRFPELAVSQQDLRSLELADASVDKIVCFNVIEHIDGQDQVMQEFQRVLKPGGVLVMGTNIRDSIAWKLYQAFIGEHTHVREFTVREFAEFVGGHFRVETVRKSSGVFRFGPPIDWIFHYILLGDVIIRAVKEG
jgi:SAM-dependent methyltransferase